ncbi:MAG: SRPBCC family protein [Actinomycetota bacterium]
MAVRVEVTTVVNRAVVDVWRFYAVEHVRNHPRWDPDMQLEQITEGPIGIGTVIRRRNTHFDTPVEGTMEVVEFDPERVMAVVIHDGPVETHGRVTFTAQGQARTGITIAAEFPDMDESSMDVGRLRMLMERTAGNIKRLVESEP